MAGPHSWTLVSRLGYVTPELHGSGEYSNVAPQTDSLQNREVRGQEVLQDMETAGRMPRLTVSLAPQQCPLSDLSYVFYHLHWFFLKIMASVKLTSYQWMNIKN